MPQRFWHVQNCSLFEHLAPSQWEQLERDARTKQFPRGCSVYLPSDSSEHLFLVHEGRIRLSATTPSGKLAVLGFIEPGEIFGELALVDGGRREERAEAVKTSTIVMFSGQSVCELMEQTASLALRVTRLMGLRRKRVERRVRSLLFRSNRERLVMLLIDLLDQYPIAGNSADELRIGIKLSHQELASLIGATRESVTLMLGSLQGEGIIRYGRQQIVIRDYQRLCEDVERSCEVSHRELVPEYR